MRLNASGSLEGELLDYAPARNADPAASRRQLEAAFRTERSWLTRYVRHHAGPEAAPDIVQEVFVRAAGSRQMGSLENVGGFLRRVARNLLIDHARSKRRRPAHLPLEEALDAPVPATQELELEAQDVLRVYEDAVAGLSFKTRRIFLMHRVEELSYREIQIELGVSLGAVEYHMHRALAHIAGKVNPAQ